MANEASGLRMEQVGELHAKSSHDSPMPRSRFNIDGAQGLKSPPVERSLSGPSRKAQHIAELEAQPPATERQQDQTHTHPRSTQRAEHALRTKHFSAPLVSPSEVTHVSPRAPSPVTHVDQSWGLDYPTATPNTHETRPSSAPSRESWLSASETASAWPSARFYSDTMSGQGSPLTDKGRGYFRGEAPDG